MMAGQEMIQANYSLNTAVETSQNFVAPIHPFFVRSSSPDTIKYLLNTNSRIASTN